MNVGFGLAGLVALATTGCGRLDFEPRSDAAVVRDTALAPCSERYTDVIFCDDFDDPSFPGWAVSPGPGSINSVVRDGQRRVQFNVGAGGGSSVLRGTLAPALVDGPVYIRVRARAPVFAQAGFIVLTQLTAAADKVSIDLETNDRLQLFAPGQYQAGPPGTFLRDTDQCLELEVRLAPAGGSGYGRLYRDRTQIAMVPAGTQTAVPGGYMLLQVGPASASSNGPIEIELDDFVLARAPVGCD